MPKKRKPKIHSAAIAVGEQEVSVKFHWPTGHEVLRIAELAERGREADALRAVFACIDELDVDGHAYDDPLDAAADVLREVKDFILRGGAGKAGGGGS